MAAIPLTTPVVKPATAEVTFNEVWLAELHIDARNGQSAKVDATLVPAATDANGKKILNYAAAKKVSLPNLFTANPTQQELTIMYDLVAAMKIRAGL